VFRTGKNIAKTPLKPSKRRILKAGMALASTLFVKASINHKEIKLFLGIIAMLIALVLWVKYPAKQSLPDTLIFPSSVPVAEMNNLVQTVAEVIF
jgi:hypothetical protein